MGKFFLLMTVMAILSFVLAPTITRLLSAFATALVKLIKKLIKLTRNETGSIRDHQPSAIPFKTSKSPREITSLIDTPSLEFFVSHLSKKDKAQLRERLLQ